MQYHYVYHYDCKGQKKIVDSHRAAILSSFRAYNEYYKLKVYHLPEHY